MRFKIDGVYYLDTKSNLSFDQIVYLKHDVDQKPRMITGITLSKQGVLYEVISGIEVSSHYEGELTDTKNLLL